jgi:endonuclease YncB( thermonuclease family)
MVVISRKLPFAARRAALGGVVMACLLGARSYNAELVIGEFALPPDAVVDGDTLRVVGIDSTLRLLAIDTEETFKKASQQRAAIKNWRAYINGGRTGPDKPVKKATPLGEEGKRFAQQFFSGVTRVRLERDHPLERQGRYGRVLAYVLAKRADTWVNYNIEAVRAGMSPYFTKYGYSRRFHRELEQAQGEARAAQRGIWDPDKRHYPDYPLRLAWWGARAEILRTFEQQGKGRRDHIVLTRADAMQRLAEHEGREVVVLGSVGKSYPIRSGLVKVWLARHKGDDLPLIFQSQEIFEQSRISEFDSEYVQVRGPVSTYVHPRSGKKELQIVIEHPQQISATVAWPPSTSISPKPSVNSSAWPQTRQQRLPP